MPVFDCTTEAGRAEGVAKAAEVARAGEVVVLPTDTVYGVGTDAFSADGVRAVLAAKGRGPEMPPPVLVPDVRAVDGLAIDVPPYARDLISAFWPGALTLVFEAQPSLLWDLGDTNGTVALRMPDDEVALALLSEVGPMAVTSANRTGEPAATTMVEAATQLGAAVRVYLDGGPRTARQASTIVDCTGAVPVVLRMGAVTEEQMAPILQAALREDPTGDAASEERGEGPSPGGGLEGEDGPEPAAQSMPAAGSEPVPATEPSVETESPVETEPAVGTEPAAQPEPAAGREPVPATEPPAAAEQVSGAGAEDGTSASAQRLELAAQQTQTAGEQSA
jgi:L-threonylcarbamoyladenylate synthase